ncbi:FAD-dependent oxidoreductase [bacterium]|nr:FAD-dependent oxidoreductase [bacterium]
MNKLSFKNLIFCYYFLIFVTTTRFLFEELIFGLEAHFFLIFHHHYWYFLVLFVCIFWFSVFLKKTFAELYWFVFLMPVILVPMACGFIFGSSRGLNYLKGGDFLENLKHIATFLLLHKDDLPISVELILVFGATLIYTFIVSRSLWKSFVNAALCYISIICIGTNFITPFEVSALLAIKTAMPYHMWMAFKYMSYAFLMIFVLFRHEILNFYRENRRFRISGIILFVLAELFFIAFFGIRPYLQNHYFYFADIFVTLVPSIVVSQTLNLLFFTKIKDFVFRKLFLAFHSLVIFTIILFYWTGWYFYIGNGYQEGFSEEAVENLQKEDKYIYDAVIVGGGLAGLKAAYDLRDSDILLLEKEDKLGGRVLTEKCGEDFCELGALFGFSDNLIPDDFEKGEIIPSNPDFGLYMNGKFYKNKDVESLLRSLNPKESRFFNDYAKTGDINKLMENLPDDTKKAIRAAFNVIHPGNFDDYSNERKKDAFTTFRFNQYVGGNASLIDAYADKISGKFELGSTVESVESQKGLVIVKYRKNGETKEIKAKTAIVATSAGAANGIVKNKSLNTQIFLNSIKYGRGMAVVFEINKKKPRDFAYLITPDNSFNTIFFNNTADGKREVLTLYFIDSFINSRPDLKEEGYILLAKEELQKIGIFNENTEILYEKAKFWKNLGTVITEHYYGFTDDAANPAEGIFLAGDFIFYDEKNPYGLEAAFFSGEAAAERVQKYLNHSKARKKEQKKEKTVLQRFPESTVQDNPLSNASRMFDEKYNLTSYSRYKIIDEKPEFIDTFDEGNIALYALIAQAANDRELAHKVADARTDDFQWEYGYEYGGTSFDSSIVLESLVSLEVDKDTVQKSLESMKKIYFRKDEGCFTTLPENIGRSAYWQGCSADVTSHLGWIFYKSDPEKYGELANSCAEYVKNVINSGSESKFKSKWFPSNFLTPYYTARLLGIFGEKYQKELNIIEKYLMSKQKENGSFSDSVLETSYALLAFKTLKKEALKTNIEQAEDWLKNNENRLPEPILYYWLDSNENHEVKIFFSCYDKGLVSEAYKKMALEK